MNKQFKNKTRKLFKNKRGEDMLVDFWAILVFAMIIMLFLIIFAANKTIYAKNIETQFATKDAEIMLISFINAPAVGTGMTSDKTVGEIIVEDTTNNDFKRTEELFKNYFSASSTGSDIYLEITGEHTESMKISNGISFFDNLKIFGITSLVQNPTILVPLKETYDAETYLPDYNSKKIYLRLKRTDIKKN